MDQVFYYTSPDIDSCFCRGLFYHQSNWGEYYVTNEFPINPVHRYSPVISGDIVIWADERNGNDDIYGTRISLKEQ